MKKLQMEKATKISLEGIAGFLKRRVTKFGTGAKIDCPKEYLGKEVYVVILEK